MSTTTNFLEAMANFQPPELKEQFFRLYYNEDGSIKCYSMEDLEGKYIEISPEEFAISNRNVYIKDGKIHKKRLVSIGKLVPSSEGTGTNPNDITLIDKESKTKWALKSYD